MKKEPTKEISEADIALADRQMAEARVKAIKGLKHMADLIISLPDDFELDSAHLDEVMKPRTETLYGACMEDELCLQDINAAGDIMGLLVSLSLGRCKNQTTNMLVELYKETLGYYEPEKEMPIREIITKLKGIQVNKLRGTN